METRSSRTGTNWSVRMAAASLGVGVLTLCPAPAGAVDPEWGPTARVSLGAPIGAPDVAVASRSGTGVVWAGASVGAASGDVRFRQQTPDGTWHAPVSLGKGGGPQIAADQSGNMVAAWFRKRPGMIPEIVAARRPVGHRWGPPVVISRVAEDEQDETGPTELDLAVSSGGAAVAAWLWGSEEGGPANRVQAAYLPAGGSWTGPTRLTTPAECGGELGVDGGVAAAIGPGGRAVVVCQGPGGVIRAIRQRAGRWPDPTRISTGSNATPDLAVGPAGETVAVWSHLVPAEDDGDQPSNVIAATRLVGTWSTPEQLTPTGQNHFKPRLAVGASEATTVVWVSSAGVIWSASKVAGLAPWTPLQAIASPGTLSSPLDLAANVHGDVVAAWTQPGPSGFDRVAVTRTGTAVWGAPVVLSGTDSVEPAEDATGVAIGGCGRALVAWQGNRTSLRRTVGCL
jgi:hypothetical protein